MADSDPQPRLIRFDDFELDTQTGELRKAGVKLKFGGQPFQVLIILLERPGELVTREQLQKRLWPDTFVDVDHNLNTAINKIREALGDSAESPRYVETVPRRGYRFVGVVIAPQTAPAPQLDPHFLPTIARTWGLAAVALVLVLALGIGIVIALRWRAKEGQPQEEAPKSSPFTALPGVETFPAMSPDGSRIAFAWNGDPAQGGKGFDLYVKAVGSETLLRLTEHPSGMLSPAWSPDGTQIAFQRMDGADTGIYLVPALGGPERKLKSTMVPFEQALPISWSPEGKWIAFSEFSGQGESYASLLSTETLQSSRLPRPPGCLRVDSLAFSHRGELLAFSCLLTDTQFGIYSQPLRGGQARLITRSPHVPWGMIWSFDDRSLIMSISARLQKTDINSGSMKQIDVAGFVEWPTASFKGDRLAVSTQGSRTNLWRRDLSHPGSSPVNLIPSTQWEGSPEYSPDGKHIAFSSTQSGVQGVWVSRDDGSELIQISNPDEPSGSPQWSPDGKWLAFDSHPPGSLWQVNTANLSERVPHKLVTNIAGAVRPSWSRDGKWIYFISLEEGKLGAYRCPATGGNATALTKSGEGRRVLESFDGTEAYLATNNQNTLLRRVPLASLPGAASDINGLPAIKSPANWTITRDGVYFVPADSPKTLRFLDFTKRQVRPLFQLEGDFGDGLSVSPDGRWVLYTQIDDPTGDILLVDHFQ